MERYGTPFELEDHEYVHDIRSSAESSHHRHLRLHHFYKEYRPQIDSVPNLPISHETAESFWNKSVPIYLLRGKKQPVRISGWFYLTVFLNYLYRAWFRPYRSDIEFRQFIARLIRPKGFIDTDDTTSVVDLVLSLTESICDRLDESWNAVEKARQMNSHLDWRSISYDSWVEVDDVDPDLPSFQHLENFSIRPLFKSIAIAIYNEDFSTCGALSRVEQIPVLIILTRKEDGLSAPITFESIKDKATLFVNEGRLVARTTFEDSC